MNRLKLVNAMATSLHNEPYRGTLAAACDYDVPNPISARQEPLQSPHNATKAQLDAERWERALAASEALYAPMMRDPFRTNDHYQRLGWRGDTAPVRELEPDLFVTGADGVRRWVRPEIVLRVSRKSASLPVQGTDTTSHGSRASHNAIARETMRAGRLARRLNATAESDVDRMARLARAAAVIDRAPVE
jgi:hypothetical protein